MPDTQEQLRLQMEMEAELEAEGGAEVGGGSDRAPSMRLARRVAELPEDPAEKSARERHEKQRLANELSHGQYLYDLGRRDPESAEAYANKQDEGALGELISVARGVPLSGPHIDELSALLQSGKTEGPE